MDKQQASGSAAQGAERRPYVKPEVMVMDEKEVLKVFQVTSAGVSWWA